MTLLTLLTYVVIAQRRLRIDRYPSIVPTMQIKIRHAGLLLVACLVLSLSIRAASAQEKIKFPVGVVTKTVGTNMFWLAAEKGFFDDVGLDVQPILQRGGLSN